MSTMVKLTSWFCLFAKSVVVFMTSLSFKIIQHIFGMINRKAETFVNISSMLCFCFTSSPGWSIWMTCCPLHACLQKLFIRSCTGTIMSSHQGLCLGCFYTHTYTKSSTYTHSLKKSFLKKIVQCWSESSVNVGAFLRKRLRTFFFVNIRFYNSILGNYSIPKSAPVNLHISAFVCTLTLAVFFSRFFGGMLLLVCLLYVAPVGWVLAGVNSTIFLWNREFCRG